MSPGTAARRLGGDRTGGRPARLRIDRSSRVLPTPTPPAGDGVSSTFRQLPEETGGPPREKGPLSRPLVGARGFEPLTSSASRMGGRLQSRRSDRSGWSTPFYRFHPVSGGTFSHAVPSTFSQRDLLTRTPRCSPGYGRDRPGRRSSGPWWPGACRASAW
jgi:hypothetical protein